MRARRLAVQARHQSAVRIQAAARGRLARQAPWRDERIMLKAKMKRKKAKRRSQAEEAGAGEGNSKCRRTPAEQVQGGDEQTAQAADQVAVARVSFAEFGLEDVSLSLLMQMTASQRLNLAGPTETSNWLIPGRILVGSCPGTHCYTSGDDVVEGKKRRSNRETVSAELRSLRDVGVTAFFNFQQRIEEKHCRPYYVNLLHEICRESTANASVPKVYRYPTADGNVWPPRVMDNILDAIEAAMREDPKQVLYLHCYGGHGRVGTVAAALLYRFYNMCVADALHIVQRNHECRRAVAQRSNLSPYVQSPCCQPQFKTC